MRRPDPYYLDLSEEQAIALNTWRHFGGSMHAVLTPEQQKRWQKLREELHCEKPWSLEPDDSRSGAYRRALKAWLEE